MTGQQLYEAARDGHTAKVSHAVVLACLHKTLSSSSTTRTCMGAHTSALVACVRHGAAD
jgi:hypothetical protein